MENIVNSTIALYKAYRKTRCGKRDNPTAAEHGRLFLQLFPGAQTITERRHNSWPKN